MAETHTGTIRRIGAKAYGFIFCADIDRDIFFYRKDAGADFWGLDIGDRVEFFVEREASGRLRARDVSKLRVI